MSDADRRRLEQRVLSGDLTGVPALARMYEREGKLPEVFVLVTHYPDLEPDTEVYASEQGALEAMARQITNIAMNVFEDDLADEVVRANNRDDYQRVIEIYEEVLSLAGERAVGNCFFILNKTRLRP